MGASEAALAEGGQQMGGGACIKQVVKKWFY